MKPFLKPLRESLQGFLSNPHESLERVLEATIAPDTVTKKTQLLSLAQSHLLGGDAFALFWAYDQSKRVLMPQHTSANGEQLSSVVALKDCIVDVGKMQKNEDISKSAPAALDNFIAQRLAGIDSSCSHDFFPARSESENENDLVGVLHTYTRNSLTPLQRNCMEYIAGALARTCNRLRQNSRLSALEQLQAAFQGKQPSTHEALAFAAQVIFNSCEPELCIVFVQSNNHLKAIASQPVDVPARKPYVAPPTSLVYRICEIQQSRRILNFQNTVERIHELGTDQYDAQLHSEILIHLDSRQTRTWLAVPVVAEGRTLAVFLLCNKRNMLAKRFTENDQAIAEAVASEIRGTVLFAETVAAMRLVTAHLSSEMQRADGQHDLSLDLLKAEARYHELYSVLIQLIPSVRCGVICRFSGPSDKPENFPLGGEEWLLEHVEAASEDEIATSNDTSTALTISGSIGSVRRRIVKRRIPGNLHFSYFLYLGLSTDNPLTEYERRMLAIICTQTGLLFLANEIVDRNLADLMQVRHAIRGSLVGVLGNVDTIMLYAKDVESKGEKNNVLAQAGLRKAIARARVYGNSIIELLDSARTLFTGLEFENLKLTQISLGRLVREKVLAFNFLAERRGLEIIFENKLSTRDVYLMDRSMIDMAISNLLDNAIKYSFRDEVIYVTLDGNAKGWFITIADNGVYIPKENYKIIFEKFVRRPIGLSGKQRPGTGLGLSMVNIVAKAHGGSVAVQSDIVKSAGASSNKGGEQRALTTFTITIPSHT